MVSTDEEIAPGNSNPPVYPKLVDTLLAPRAAPGMQPDSVVAHVLATCAGYAYSDARTLAMIMARLGLEKNHCRMVAQSVDAMFIASTAFLVQSRDGKVAILCYRGTEPFNFGNWLTSTDVVPEKVAFRLQPVPDGRFDVHAGFYRNVQATRDEVVAALGLALDGESITGGDSSGIEPLEALYITGHSLGGAMAALMAVMLKTDTKYGGIADKIRAVYTFGQPMIGEPEFAEACEQLVDRGGYFFRDNMIRYVYSRDLVPYLPPTASGPFAHFGREYQYLDVSLPANLIARFDEAFKYVRSPAPGILGKMVEAPIAFLDDRLRRLRRRQDPLVLAVETPLVLVNETLKLARSVTLNPRALVEAPAAFLARKSRGDWNRNDEPAQQLPFLLSLVEAPVAFLARKILVLRNWPFVYSIEDHLPIHYISALTPPDVVSEFGD